MADDVQGMADERRRLLNELELERKQLIRNIETCRIRDIDRPFIDRWSLKDIVGHVADWEAECTKGLEEVREGKRPALLDPDPDQTDEWNKVHAEAKRNVPFWTALDELKAGRTRFLEAIAAFSDEDLCAEDSVAQAVVGVTIRHDREHWHEIAARLAGMAGVRRLSPDPNEATTTSSP